MGLATEMIDKYVSDIISKSGEVLRSLGSHCWLSTLGPYVGLADNDTVRPST